MTRASVMFVDGNIGSWPERFIGGNDYETDIAQFFYNGRSIFQYTTDEQMEIERYMNSTMKHGLVRVALGQGNYFILKDGHKYDDCPNVSGGKQVNGSCFTLECPYKSVDNCGPQSKPISEKTYGNLTTKFGIDIKDIYESSVQCQEATNQYYGGHPFGLQYKQILDGYSFVLLQPPCL
ncbi:hypothetical protein PHISP_04203 [Aspergillus sp. HF37]|nr:hypothetical protein PHISP_04203 [Aspergillus sp. HF37]